MGDTFCISDLHLGDRGPRDNFAVGGRENRLFAFLDYVEREGGHLVIPGDLFEWWQCGIQATLTAYAKLGQRLSDMDALWVLGNHDAAGIVIYAGMATSGPFVDTIGGRKWLFCHGHEGDPYCNSQNPGLGEISAILTGLIEDHNKGPVEESGRAVEDIVIGRLEQAVSLWNHHHGRENRLDEMIDAVEAYRMAGNTAADAVVYGHTHAAGRIGDYHYNCGCWCRDRDTFVRVDGATGSASLFEWTEAGPVAFDKELRAVA